MSTHDRPPSQGAGHKPQGTYFLGRYRVVDEIGIGGMASVHLARMDGPGGFQKWVAIKRIHPHLLDDESFIQSFLDEARIAARISHANVAQVFDLGQDGDTYWIAMEYLHGEPLREVMRRVDEGFPMMSLDLAARIVSDAAEGLHAAHELKDKDGKPLLLVHRDVTPHNLFLTYDGTVKVVDFGIAKIADRASTTRAGTLKGKIAYMSPEQVRGGAELDRRTDVFALGVVLWELTTGKRLFRMESDLETLDKVQACVVPPPSSLVRGYPADLEAIVLKALSRRKEDRYATARDVARALQNYLIKRGKFVGPEDVSAYVRSVFPDRIEKREAHLAWATEVTQTLALGSDAGGGPTEISTFSDDEISAVTDDGKPEAPRPAAGVPVARTTERLPSFGAFSGDLEDLEDDIKTVVIASRDVLVQQAAARSAPRPAAGAPATVTPPVVLAPGVRAEAPRPVAPLPPARGASLASMARTVIGVGGGPPAPPASPYAAPVAEAPPPPPPPPPVVLSTQGAGQAAATQVPSTVVAAHVPSFVVAPPSAAPPPRTSVVAAAPSYAPPPAPAPAGEGASRRGLLVALIAAVTVIGVAGIGAFSALKWRSMGLEAGEPTAPRMTSPASPVAAAPAVAAVATTAPAAPVIAPTVAATAVPAAAPIAPATPVAAAAPVAQVAQVAQAARPFAATPTPAAPVAARPATPVPTPAAAPRAAAPAAAAESAGGPGFFTVVCNPFCEDVRDGSRSLGPSPVVHASLSPGEHRIMLRRAGSPTKVISVVIVSGQTTSRREQMAP